MTEETDSKAARRRIRIRIPYVILLALMGIFAYKFVEKTHQIHQLAAQANALQVQNQQTQQLNEQIRRQLPYYQSSDYVAEQARGRLGYVMPGDTLIESNPVQQPAVQVRPAPPPPAAPPKAVWQQWWDTFFGS